jgi:hypothetical protein
MAIIQTTDPASSSIGEIKDRHVEDEHRIVCATSQRAHFRVERRRDLDRLGVLPLALSTGAGSGSQNAIGTSIVGGAITTTLLGLFFVPLYFLTVMRLFKVKPTHAPEDPDRPEDENLDDDEAPEEKKELAHV